MKTLCLLSCCVWSACIRSPLSNDKLVIEFARTGCFIPCPVYKVSIFADGRVHFNGAEQTLFSGDYWSHIDADSVALLLDEARQLHILIESPPMVTDLPGHSLWVTFDTVPIQIDRNGTTAEIGRFEEHVDRMARVIRWVGSWRDRNRILAGDTLNRFPGSDSLMHEMSRLDSLSKAGKLDYDAWITLRQNVGPEWYRRNEMHQGPIRDSLKLIYQHRYRTFSDAEIDSLSAAE